MLPQCTRRPSACLAMDGAASPSVDGDGPEGASAQSIADLRLVRIHTGLEGCPTERSRVLPVPNPSPLHYPEPPPRPPA